MSVFSVEMSPQTRRIPAVPTEEIWRLTIDQYHGMIDGGILTDDDPVELLEGWLVPKMPKSPRHRVTTRLCRKALEEVVPAGWYVESQEPITLAESEPEPDVAIIKGETRDYADRHPGPPEVPLVVEVSDTTLARDRGSKMQIYARAGIPIYWIVNLINRQIEVSSDPTGPAKRPRYRKRRVYSLDKVVPVTITGHQVGRISVRNVLS